MKMFQSMKAHFKRTAKDMKGMTFREKVDHLWTYYKEYAFAIIMALIIVGAVIVSLFTPVPTLVSSGTLVNVSLSLEGHDYLTDVFYEQVLGSPDGKVALNTANYSNQDTVDAVDESYQAFMGVSAKVEAKELDYLLLDQVGLDFYGSEDMIMDLRRLLPQEELEQLFAEDRLRFAMSEEGDALKGTEEEDFSLMHSNTYIPIAIDLTGTKFAQEAIQTQMPVYISFIDNTPNFETCQKLWEHIKNW